MSSSSGANVPSSSQPTPAAPKSTRFSTTVEDADSVRDTLLHVMRYLLTFEQDSEDDADPVHTQAKGKVSEAYPGCHAVPTSRLLQAIRSNVSTLTPWRRNRLPMYVSVGTRSGPTPDVSIGPSCRSGFDP